MNITDVCVINDRQKQKFERHVSELKGKHLCILQLFRDGRLKRRTFDTKCHITKTDQNEEDRSERP